MTHKHAIIHVEIPANESAAAAKFYKDVFEWNIVVDEEMDYTMFTGDEGDLGGGYTPVDDENPVGNILLYINTPDLKASLEKIKASGGEVVLESYEIPTVGTMATFKDPTGNLLALLEPVSDM
jgi:predicted enzyme related to lactoylglutathione lyase